MSNQSDKALQVEMFEAINRGDFVALDNHPGFWETREVVPPMRAFFANWRTPLVQQIAEDGKLFCYGVTEFDHVGPFAGIAPTGKRVSLSGFFLDQVKDNILFEHNGATNWANILRQLGQPAFVNWPAHTPRLLNQSRLAAPGNAALRAANKAIAAELLSAISAGDEDATTPHEGIGQLRDEFAAIRAAFPDLRYELVMQVAEGELVGTRATLRGTHSGTLYGFAPTGRALAWDYFALARVANGAIIEAHGSADWTAALVQLGLFPQ